MAQRVLRACLLLFSLAAVGAASAAGNVADAATSNVADAARLPASFDARDAFYGCADIVLDQARPRGQRRRRRSACDAQAPAPPVCSLHRSPAAAARRTPYRARGARA